MSAQAKNNGGPGPVDEVQAQLDFRTFIELLRQDGDLVDITQEVDPHLEVGAIVRRVSETNDKAPLFSNVKGARGGLWRMFGNAASLRGGSNRRTQLGRLARNLGLPVDATWGDLCRRTQEGKVSRPLAPNVVDSGPCKENKIASSQVDLDRLPVPQLHMEDGGRYIQTYGVHVLQSPDESWTNWSIFRGMVYDRNHIVCLVNPGQHNHMMKDMWQKQGSTEIPWALALGVPPIATIAAAMPIPEGISEGEYVGRVVGRPLDLVKCELSTLLVPANSEIVLEGAMSLVDTADEGPFGDYLGYAFDSDRRKMPLFRVDAITHRNDAILPVSVPGRITDESHTTAALAAAEVFTFCKNHDLPIKEAFAPLETMATWCALQVDMQRLAALKTTSKAFCEQLGRAIFNDKSSMLVNRLLVVGEDIDVYDFQDVMWAYVTRCRPGQDEYVFEDVPGFPLTPYMSHGSGDRRRGGKSVSDCLLPMEYEGKASFKKVDFEHSYPDEVKQKVRANWKTMGFSNE